MEKRAKEQLNDFQKSFKYYNDSIVFVAEYIKSLKSRQNSGSPWQINQCFELIVSNPYYNSTNNYKTFQQQPQSVCTSNVDGVTVSCSFVQSDTISFIFTSISSSASKLQTLSVNISNFQNPYSSQYINTINIRYSSDQYCFNNIKTISLPGLTIQQQVLPSTNVQLSSSSVILGDTSPNNTLTIAFTPFTTMSKSGAGKVTITLPSWYSIRQTPSKMYNPTTYNKCTSNQMQVQSSQLVGNSITIDYFMMNPIYFQSKITISCQGFYNPITPEIWNGFQLTLYDSELNYQIIEQTLMGNLYFDATQFQPDIIPLNYFSLDPSNSTVGTYSQWKLTLRVNIPLQQGCFIKLSLPQDISLDLQEFEASGIFLKPDLNPKILLKDITPTYGTDLNGNRTVQSVVFQGCNDISTVGRSPIGSMSINYMQNQDSVRDSGTFGVQIYKDRGLNLLIAQLQQNSLVQASKIIPGFLYNLTIIPTNQQVGQSTNINISFIISHQLNAQAGCLITLPYLLTVDPSQITNQGSSQYIGIIWPNGTKSLAAILSGNTINVTGIVAGKYLPAGSVVSFQIVGIINQNSVKDAGGFSVTTQNLFQANYYDVDQMSSPNSYIATPGQVNAVGLIQVMNRTNSATDVTYTFRFTLQNSLPIGGFLIINTPVEVNFDIDTTYGSSCCKVFTCTSITSNSIQLLTSTNYNAGQVISISVGGFNNPRSFKPTGNFTITSIDTDGISLIDTGYNKSTAMTIPGAITSFSALQTNTENSQLTSYTFSAQPIIPLLKGDSIQFTFPVEVNAPRNSSSASCIPISNVLNLTCFVNYQTLTVVFNNFTNNQSSFVWLVQDIQNPSSTKPSSSFTNVNFIDSDGYAVSSYYGTTTVTDTNPTPIVTYSITQGSYLPNQYSSFYAITFYTVNPIPTTGSILMTYPPQISLLDGSNTGCSVTTASGTFNTNCVVNDTSRSIIITKIFASTQFYSGQITITLLNVQNPITNKPQNGFIISTYADANQDYLQDKLFDFLLQPRFQCNWPCLSCNPSFPNICTSCWQKVNFPNYLMTYPNSTKTCTYSCDPGYTTNGDSQLRCQACDPSCTTCADNSTVGDVKNCLICANNYPFRLTQTQYCLQSCSLGVFQSSNSTCTRCQFPCQGCQGTPDTCTQCFQNISTPFQFDNKCVSACPIGYTSVNGVCEKCQTPCATCLNSTNSCLTCDNSGNFNKYLYQNRCWNTCPPGSGPNTAQATCFPCQQGCDLCDVVNKTFCLKCTKPNLTYYGGCVSECPYGWHINSPEGDGRACRLWRLSDLGTLPYPFLIATGFFIIICLLGMIKRRAILYRNKMKFISPQQTLTCIIVVLAPIQFFATIAQWVLSYYYGTITFGILALVVTIAAIIVNITFQVWFQKRFDSKKIPYEYQRRVLLYKITQKEAEQHQGPRDENFSLYKKQNCFTVYTVYILTSCFSYKFNKLFYSFFYDLKSFQAQFSNPKQYRKILTSFQTAQIVCVDLALICIDITALTQIEQGNQLHITIIETLVLSFLSIILGAIELCLLKKILKYTEAPKDQTNIKKEEEEEDDDAFEENIYKKFNAKSMSTRRILMSDIIKQVKHNKYTFLNNKLDDLLLAFGDRKCKSMLDLNTGWQLEDDPRFIITYPISPQLEEDYQGFDVKFNKLDAYGIQDKNSQNEKQRLMQIEMENKIDEGLFEFQDALNRKHGGININAENYLEEKRLRRKNKRRGRKNQYHAQIQHEDELEAEQFEASENEQNEFLMQVLKDAREFEENQINMRDANQQKQNKKDRFSLNKQQTSQSKRATSKISGGSSQKQTIDIEERIVNDFNKLENKMIDIPPRVQLRTFNENDIFGDVERDEKGIVIIQESNNGLIRDKAGHLINQRGYLINKDTGAIIENQTFQKMFSHSEIDEKGEVPSPFNIEKYNFNPHNIMGDFDYNQGQPQILEKEKGSYFDKAGRQVNKHGWITLNDSGHLFDMNGRKKFDRSQLQEGDLPKLLNYEQRSFDIRSVMGRFKKDKDNKICPQQDKQGKIVDLQGRRVNEKGYLIDKAENIVDENNKIIWLKQVLKSGEFPKIFPFTKFNIKRVQGEYQLNQQGLPILFKVQRQKGQYLDNNKRLVNQKGFLIDKDENVIDKYGKIVFDRVVLDKDGDIPKVFKSGFLKAKTSSSLSRLMSEIEKEDLALLKPSDLQNQNNLETSFDSQMQNNLYNFNVIDQKTKDFHEKTGDTIDDETDGQIDQIPCSSESQIAASQVDKKKKKRFKMPKAEVLPPTQREKVMADTYGGQAVGSIKRPGVKQEKNRNKDKYNFRGNTPDEHLVKGSISQLESSQFGKSALHGGRRDSEGKSVDLRDQRMNVKNGGFMGSKLERNLSNDKSILSNSREVVSRSPDSRAVLDQKKNQKPAILNSEEIIFSKEIDKFIEDSDWGGKSSDKFSESSNQGDPSSNKMKMKQLENLYMKAAQTSSK